MVDSFAASVAAGELITPAEDGLAQMQVLDQIIAAASSSPCIEPGSRRCHHRRTTAIRGEPSPTFDAKVIGSLKVDAVLVIESCVSQSFAQDLGNDINNDRTAKSAAEQQVNQ